MKFRNSIVMLIAALAVLASITSTVSFAQGEKPNVVLMLADNVGWGAHTWIFGPYIRVIAAYNQSLK